MLQRGIGGCDVNVMCVRVQDCDIDEENDTDRIDELLELCVRQALQPSDSEGDVSASTS